MFNTIFKKALLTLSLAGMVSFSALPAITNAAGTYPGNYTDTSYSWSVASNTGSYYYTETRPKQNDSYLYMYCKAAADLTGTGRAVSYYAVAQTGSGAQDTRNVTYYFTQGTKHSMTNYVYEDGYRDARIKMWTPNAYSSFSGLWSPDSIGYYN